MTISVKAKKLPPHTCTAAEWKGCQHPICLRIERDRVEGLRVWNLNSARCAAWSRIVEALLEGDVISEEHYCEDWTRG